MFSTQLVNIQHRAEGSEELKLGLSVKSHAAAAENLQCFSLICALSGGLGYASRT